MSTLSIKPIYPNCKGSRDHRARQRIKIQSRSCHQEARKEAGTPHADRRGSLTPSSLDCNSVIAREGMRTGRATSSGSSAVMTHQDAATWSAMPKFAEWLRRKGKWTIWLRPTCPRCLGPLSQKMASARLVCLDCNQEFSLNQVLNA